MLTRSGLGLLLFGIVAAGLGLWWKYEELVVGAVAAGAILLMAVLAAQRPLRATVTRRVDAVRIARGDPIPLTYKVRNTTAFRSGRAVLVDTCDGVEGRVELAPVAARTEELVDGTIATRRRGVFDVGPFDIVRIDPLWLAVGRRADRATASVIVHPKVYDLSGPHGAVRVVENESVIRRATTDPMSGFVSMREYVSGDDPRLIHWPTTARVGTLMVREHVEVRRPEFTVVLDTAERVIDPDDFEEAVDVAATLAAHAVRTGLDVVLRTTSRAHPGTPASLGSEPAVLDLLTPVQRSTDDETVAVATLFAGGLARSAVLMVTGPNGPSSRFASLDQMTTIRVGRGAEAGAGVLFAADDAHDFVQRWRSWS
ncbi:MAG: DUF58 domain-containing protein [Ilumatobacteraceae bacterium]|nr:DUF58 domain-containing protein [Ilumatobacteraceae bacterium]